MNLHHFNRILLGPIANPFLRRVLVVGILASGQLSQAGGQGKEGADMLAPRIREIVAHVDQHLKKRVKWVVMGMALSINSISNVKVRSMIESVMTRESQGNILVDIDGTLFEKHSASPSSCQLEKDRDGRMKPISTKKERFYPICYSSKLLAEVNASLEEVEAGFIHDFYHHFGFEDEDAELIQYDVRKNYKRYFDLGYRYDSLENTDTKYARLMGKADSLTTLRCSWKNQQIQKREIEYSFLGEYPNLANNFGWSTTFLHSGTSRDFFSTKKTVTLYNGADTPFPFSFNYLTLDLKGRMIFSIPRECEKLELAVDGSVQADISSANGKLSFLPLAWW